MRAIEPASAPGGLVFVLYGPGGDEIERAEFGPGARSSFDAGWVAARHAASVRERGGSVIVFDGDSGRALCELDRAGMVIP